MLEGMRGSVWTLPACSHAMLCTAETAGWSSPLRQRGGSPLSDRPVPVGPVRAAEVQKARAQPADALQDWSEHLGTDVRVSSNSQSRSPGKSPRKGSATQKQQQQQHEPGNLGGFVMPHLRPRKPREPTLEERFWQFTPDLPEGSDSEDSADERALVSI